MRYGSWIVLMGLVSVGGLAAPLAFAQSAPRKFPPPPRRNSRFPLAGHASMLFPWRVRFWPGPIQSIESTNIPGMFGRLKLPDK